MGSMPLPALDIQKPPDLLQQFAQVSQIKSMLLGQKLSEAELQGHQLENQQRQVTLAGTQRVVAAQNDPQWDATDPDRVRQLLTKYSVPLPMQATVMEGIGKMREAISKNSSDNMVLTQKVHNYFDDQLTAAKSAPPDQHESVYQEGLANAGKFIKQLVPAGPVQQSMLGELAQAPPFYDQTWIDTHHALLRTSQDLNEEGLKKAQTREASGKGFQAEQEGLKTQAQIPGAQAQSTIEQQNAAQGPTGRALAGNLFYQAAGGNKQASGALNLETSQKVAAAQAAVANVPDALKGVAPHLVGPAAAAAEKAGNEYGDAVAAARDMKTFVDLAKGGNKIAYAYSPTEGVLTLNTARGVKRVNMAEIGSYGGAGSALDRVKGFFGKQTSGASIPDNVLNDMETLHQSIAGNAQATYANKLKNTNSTYGSHFQPVNMGGPPAGATGKAKGSDGKWHWTDGKQDLGAAE